MAKRRSIRGQGSVYARGAWWHVCYSVNGRKHRESAHTQIREEALAFLQRKLGKAASGEGLSPDRVKISDLLTLVQNDYDLKETSILLHSCAENQEISASYFRRHACCTIQDGGSRSLYQAKATQWCESGNYQS